MPKYIAKPTIIEAWEITEENLHSLRLMNPLSLIVLNNELGIMSATGNVRGKVGDYLCKNEIDFYPCPQEIFEKKYELVNEV